MNIKRFIALISLLFLCCAGISCSTRTSFQQYPKTPSPAGNVPESLETVLELNRESFEQVILPSLHGLCKRCHRKYFDEYEMVLSLVSAGDPVKSKLYQRAKGEGEDDHPEVWPTGSQELEALEKWILGEPLDEIL